VRASSIRTRAVILLFYIVPFLSVSHPPDESFELTDGEVLAPPSVRAQSAVVRTLTDALEQHGLSSETLGSLRAQLAEELDRLGLRIDEASALVRAREAGGTVDGK
jgi:hypothetical protein